MKNPNQIKSQSLRSNLPARLEFVREKLWWFDVIYPIALALFLFGIVTFIVFGGRESSRLSLLSERSLLEISLRYAPIAPLKSPGKVATVSGSIFEIDHFSGGSYGSTPDFPIAVYQSVLKSLVDQGVPNIILIWRSENHPRQESYYSSMRSYLLTVRNKSKIGFVTNVEEAEGVKNYLGDVADIYDNLPCANNDTDESQTYCPILPQSTDWIAQWLLNNFYSKASVASSVPPGHFPTKSWHDYIESSWRTRYLPSTVPGYITNLSSPLLIPDRNFSEVMSPHHNFAHNPSLVFVGLDLTGSIAPTARPGVPIAIKTVSQGQTAPRTSAKLGGTPLHQYWDAIGQTFVEGRIPTVASPLIVWVINASIGIVILCFMYYFGGTLASLTLIFWCLIAPILNIFLLHYCNFYLPIFNSYYLGFSLLIISGFARLSFTALSRWRIEEKSRSHLNSADLKSNFISLLSHNLNTPIAKMQGMLGLLTLGQKSERRLEHLQCAEFYLAELQLVIKSVLVATTLEEGAARDLPRTVTSLVEEFRLGFGPLMRQLGVMVDIQKPVASDEDLLFLPLAFDQRALTTALAAVAALAATTMRENQVGSAESPESPEAQGLDSSPQLIGLSVTIFEVKDQIRVCFEFTLGKLPLGQVRPWFDENKNRTQGFRGRAAEDFVQGVFGGLVLLAADYYQGSLECFDAPHQGSLVKLVLGPRQDV